MGLPKKVIQRPVGFNMFDERLAVMVLGLTSPDIDSTDAVAELFEPLIQGRSSPSRPDQHASFEIGDWKAAQEWLLRWLPDIARYDRLTLRQRDRILTSINRIADQLATRVGRTGIEWATDHDTVWCACVRACAPFLIPQGWDPHRLGQCQYDKCNQWFLRPEPKRGSVPLYCSQRHANSARVGAFRQRQESHQ